MKLLWNHLYSINWYKTKSDLTDLLTLGGWPPWVPWFLMGSVPQVSKTAFNLHFHLISFFLFMHLCLLAFFLYEIFYFFLVYLSSFTNIKLSCLLNVTVISPDHQCLPTLFPELKRACKYSHEQSLSSLLLTSFTSFCNR